MPGRFRLSRLLGLRSQLRKLTQDEVALLGTNLARLQDAVVSLRATRDETRVAVNAAVGAGIVSDELVRWEAWERALAAREVALVEERERATEALERGREELLVRRREEQKLERLRDRALEGGRAEEAHASDLLLDDLALRPHRESR